MLSEIATYLVNIPFLKSELIGDSKKQNTKIPLKTGHALFLVKIQEVSYQKVHNTIQNMLCKMYTYT